MHHYFQTTRIQEGGGLSGSVAHIKSNDWMVQSEMQLDFKIEIFSRQMIKLDIDVAWISTTYIF